MASIEWAHFCDYAFKDRSGCLSLISILDAVHTSRHVGAMAGMYLALGIKLDEGEQTAEIGIIPRGLPTQLKTATLTVEAKPGEDRRSLYETFLMLTGWDLPVADTYVLEVDLTVNGQPRKTLTVTIIHDAAKGTNVF